MLRLFDTARGGVFPLEPRDPGKVSMYVCGPTVYGPPHLGHGRFSLVFDVLRRYLLWRGYDVRYVSNITDVDDNIINRAARENVDWTEVATHWEKVWWEAMDAIGVMRPDVDPHASAFIERMVELVGSLVDHGVAYETGDGVYFQAERVEDYGLLARQSIESLRAGARVETNEEKRAPVDFALWKKAKPGEPSWDSPWGPGRPGWHTECVVMSLDLLGDGFDIHGGGQDLAFPHHENERAQAVAEGHRFVRHWVHNGWVVVEGEKMSKSLGNFTDLLDLIEWSDPRAYRLLVLRSHYRAPIEVTRDSVADAGRALERLDRFGERFADAQTAEPDAGALARFRELMDDDMSTPAAMALLFELVTRANADDDQSAAAAAFQICAAVGLELRTSSAEIDDAADALRIERDEARAAKDWSRADALRDELVAIGYEVADTPAGTEIRRR
ncbi:MAG TPA: cysteine--tRNA ligase [Acidimicrobiales bacterium]|jgi:cysteinyl-tRNA synthetase|nr:cysteine--tRNA ligase [Acidimicrobiales bacterium]